MQHPACAEPIKRGATKRPFCTRSQRRQQRAVHLAAIVLLLVATPQGLPAAPPPAPNDSARRSRVVIVRDSQATEAFEPHVARVQAMVSKGLLRLTGKANPRAAWLSLVSTQDNVGIKVFSRPGPNTGTRLAVVAAVVEGLLAAELPPNNIIVWDKDTTDLKLAGFFDLSARYGIRVTGSVQAGYDPGVFYESPILGNLVWGDLEFEKKGEKVGRRSFISKLVTRRITKIINVTPLLNHNLAGVSGNLFSLASGSVDNFFRFEVDPGRLAIAVPEIYNLPALNDKVALNIVDALICQYEGAERSLLHYSAALNQLRFSRDPVALDVLSLQELERQRKDAGAPEVRQDLELYQNAALLELGVYDKKRIDTDEVKEP